LWEHYRVTSKFPSDERFGLTAELRKTVRSIPYNIAEGHRRASTREYVRFLDIASGSAGELETQLLLSRALGHVDQSVCDGLLGVLAEVDRMLTALTRRLRQRVNR